MKTINLLLITILLFGFQSSDAQLFKKVKKAIKDKAENKIVDKAADKTGKVMDDKLKDGESRDSNKNDGGGMDMSGIMGGMMKKVDIESSYTFDISVKLKVTEFGKKEKTNEVDQSYGQNVFMTGLEDQQLIITDLDNEAAIMINVEDKTAQTLSMAWMKKMMDGQDIGASDESAIDFSKTGRTAIKHGYKTEEYLIKHDDGKAEVWFAPEVDFSYSDFMSGFSKLFSKSVSGTIPMSQGYVMDMTTYDKKGKKENRMEVIELSKDKQIINMSDYEIQKMF